MMIWGSTQRRRNADDSWLFAWHEVFCWSPVRLMDGRRLWLQRAERISYHASEIPVRAIVNTGGWCYREIDNG